MRIKIRDWDTHFERDRSRQWKTIQWVPIPNKQGAGYRKIMKQVDKFEIYACWIALVLVASHCDPRGDLSKYDLEALADLTLLPEKSLKKSICFLSETLDWIEVVESSIDINVNDHDKSVNDNDISVCLTPVSSSILFNSIQSYSILFNSIYEAYPRKVGKAAAIKAIQKAAKKINPEELLSKVKLYAESVQDKEVQFIPHASTWFNQERFNDPIEKNNTTSQKKYGPQKVSDEDMKKFFEMDLPE